MLVDEGKAKAWTALPGNWRYGPGYRGAFAKGLLDFLTNKPTEACPYKRLPEKHPGRGANFRRHYRLAWLLGWRLGRREFKVGRELRIRGGLPRRKNRVRRNARVDH